MMAYDCKIKMSHKDNEVPHFLFSLEEPTMHKIVLTIPHMLTDLIILWEDRLADNFKIRMFEISDNSKLLWEGKKGGIQFFCAVLVKPSLWKCI